MNALLLAGALLKCTGGTVAVIKKADVKADGVAGVTRQNTSVCVKPKERDAILAAWEKSLNKRLELLRKHLASAAVSVARNGSGLKLGKDEVEKLTADWSVIPERLTPGGLPPGCKAKAPDLLKLVAKSKKACVEIIYRKGCSRVAIVDVDNALGTDLDVTVDDVAATLEGADASLQNLLKSGKAKKGKNLEACPQPESP